MSAQRRLMASGVPSFVAGTQYKALESVTAIHTSLVLKCIKKTFKIFVCVGLLLRLIYTSKNSSQVLQSTIFPALLSISDTQIRSDTLAILIKTIPQNLPENAPSCDEIVKVIQEENDEELLKNAMLCLILLKQYAQVDLQKMISVFSMAKCKSILKTFQYES